MNTVIYVTLASGTEYEIHCTEESIDEIVATLPENADWKSYSSD